LLRRHAPASRCQLTSVRQRLTHNPSIQASVLRSELSIDPEPAWSVNNPPRR
jgi:hypothetical protein